MFAGTSAGCLDRPVAADEPKITNIFVDPLKQQAVDKIDLLFMIDNSRSMADKQRILEQAVPELVNRLITPRCTDDAGNLTSGTAPNCPPGSVPEFDAVDDIHIGIVTSSLGGHGADTCSPRDTQNWNSTQDDKAQLLPSVPRSEPAPQFQNTGFLAWDPGGKYGGETNRQALIDNFEAGVRAAGEDGCGFEASLEAWYRFLIDPEPPLEVVVKDGQAQVTRPNPTVLSQRAQFLRPDSLVAIVMLTDENDCSTIDGGVGWLAAQAGEGGYHLPRATEVCARNPNDRCCRSCRSDEAQPPAGCPALNADPGCSPPDHDNTGDPINLRCWEQKRRFGLDFLYGVDRYIRGLTSVTIRNHTGEEVRNPLYSDLSGKKLPPRSQSLVFLAGIVGVPWQDIATENTLNNPSDLKYLKASELAAKKRWEMILGDPPAGVPPTDALMIESVQDRTTLRGVNPAHPLGLGSLVPVPAAGQPHGTAINGNEYVTDREIGDLQYACIFPLDVSRQCAGSMESCDCEGKDQGNGKPLCNGTLQIAAKAYPGIRHLQVLKGVSEMNLQKDNAIVASICPKITTDPNNAAYGYNPAVASIIDALKVQLRGKCLPRQLDVDLETGKVPCAVVEAMPSTNGACACDPGRGRAEITGERQDLIGPVLKRLDEIDHCGENTGLRCEDLCLCEILPVQSGPAEQTCLTDPTASNSGNQYGYCYVDPKAGRGSEAVVDKCPATQKRKIQFIGEDTPANGSIALVACLGSNVTDRGDGGR